MKGFTPMSMFNSSLCCLEHKNYSKSFPITMSNRKAWEKEGAEPEGGLTEKLRHHGLKRTKNRSRWRSV